MLIMPFAFMYTRSLAFKNIRPSVLYLWFASAGQWHTIRTISYSSFVVPALSAFVPLCASWNIWAVRILWPVNSLTVTLRGDAEKSLARSVKKQATTTKLRIYSTYSPCSSIHFLTRCSNFCNPLKKKKNLKVVHSTRSPQQQWPPRRKKNGDLSIVFSVREQEVVRRGQIRRKGWVIKTMEAQVGHVLLVCKCPMSGGIVVQEQDWLVTFPRRFSFKMSFNCTSRDE